MQVSMSLRRFLKLIFTKLYDEFKSQNDKIFIDHLIRTEQSDDIENPDYEVRKTAIEKVPDSNFRSMEFRNTGQTESQLKAKIQRLFDDARDRWRGVFSRTFNI